jgi:hypothetical protein
MDALNHQGWCVIDAWKLRLWFGVERISKGKWQDILDHARRDLPAGVKVLAFYNGERSSHAIFMKWGTFELTAPGKSAKAAEQVRAWIDELF